jgi:hypothetical protein
MQVFEIHVVDGRRNESALPQGNGEANVHCCLWLVAVVIQ